MDDSLDPDDIAYAGVLGQRDLLRTGRLTATELLEISLARIDRFDGRVGAFRTLFRERARTEAAALSADDDRPLAGIPVAVKDGVRVEGHPPSYGTGSAEPPAAADDEVVRRLRDAGAVVVGVTKLPELALWPFTESQMWGSTRNPWDLSRTPGGSSGGSGAAVAAGMVAAATASDGGGSIRIPAACCGLVGLKPQRDRVPMGSQDDLHAAHWHGLSVMGCLTRGVADHALVLSVMSGGSIGAEVTEPGPLRIAWSTRTASPAPVDPAVHRALRTGLALLRDLGHEVVAADPSYKGIPTSFTTRFLRGAADDHAALANPAATEFRTRVVAAVGRRVSDSALRRAVAAGDAAGRRLATLPGGADVLVTPTLARPPVAVGALRGLATLVKAPRIVGFTPPWNVTGQPALSVPVSTHEGVPLAIQLVGPPDSEALLLGLAAQVERVTGFPDRRPPLG
ncbi:MAG: amidase family protein [Mycobacteriales bacterium]|nr:amidase family protein [Mycobacteriales bacterium]